MTRGRVRAVHYRSRFLPLTESWIYNQVLGLGSVVAGVYAVSRVNRDVFPCGKVRCLREDLGGLPLFFNRAWYRLFRWCPQFLRWFREDRPSLIHAHFGPGGYDMLPFVRLLEIPLITSFYGYDAYQLPRTKPRWLQRYRRLFEEGRLFLAEGPAMREKLVELGCPQEKAVVHHIGVKPADYEFHARKAGGEIRLMVCGRFVEKKGIPYAVEALKRVRSKAGDSVRLTIVGDSDRGGTLTDEKRKILHAIDRCGVSGAVTITGYTPHDEVMRMARDHHIFLAPSVHASDGDAEGGFPVILTEILATGMPVVASDHCDIPRIVQDGKSGFIVPERDAEALSGRILHLIEHPGAWEEMGRRGRSFVEEHYDIEKLNRRLERIYQDLAAGDEVRG